MKPNDKCATEDEKERLCVALFYVQETTVIKGGIVPAWLCEAACRRRKLLRKKSTAANHNIAQIQKRVAKIYQAKCEIGVANLSVVYLTRKHTWTAHGQLHVQYKYLLVVIVLPLHGRRSTV